MEECAIDSPPPRRGVKVLFFPRFHRTGALLPLSVLHLQHCLVCKKRGCVVRLITPADKGGTQTGDNCLLVCKRHQFIPLLKLYRESPHWKKWLLEHERVDIVLYLERRMTGGEYDDEEIR